MKGQLSAEMLVLIVVVLAVLAVVANELLRTAEEGSQRVRQQSGDIFEQTGATTTASAGEYCSRDEDCESRLCSGNRCL